MAWSDPAPFDYGEMVGPDDLNLHVYDLLALRAGGLAISGMAAGCIPYASSEVQLAASANLAFNGSSLVVAGAADDSGLIISATTTNRSTIFLQNHDTGVLAKVQADNNGRLLLYSAGFGTPTIIVQGSSASVGGVTIGPSLSAPAAGCLHVEGGAVAIGDSTDAGVQLYSGNGSGVIGGPNFIRAAGGAFGGGAIGGSYLEIGRNSSVNGAAGYVSLQGRDGDTFNIWPDDAGLLRIGTAPPYESGTPADNSGAVVGGQVSWHAFKTNIRLTALSPDDALQAVVAADIWDFEYPETGYEDADGRPAQFTGFVGYDRRDWFLKNVGPQQVPALNEISILGRYALAFKALEARLVAVEAR